MWHPAPVPVLLLAGVLLVDLLLSLVCWTWSWPLSSTLARALLGALPWLLYVAALPLVARDSSRAAQAVRLALVAAPLWVVGRISVEALAPGPWYDAGPAAAHVGTLLVALPLVAAWGIARLDGAWHLGLLAIPVVTGLQVLLHDSLGSALWDAAYSESFDSDLTSTTLPLLGGTLWWLWGVAPVLVGGLSCWMAAVSAPLAGTTTARHPRG